MEEPEPTLTNPASCDAPSIQRVTSVPPVSVRPESVYCPPASTSSISLAPAPLRLTATLTPVSGVVPSSLYTVPVIVPSHTPPTTKHQFVLLPLSTLLPSFAFNFLPPLASLSATFTLSTVCVPALPSSRIFAALPVFVERIESRFEAAPRSVRLPETLCLAEK